MITRPLLTLLVPAFLAASLHAQISKAPIFEEAFNVAHSRLEFRNGAALGAPGTGVSGKLSDRAYVAVPKTTEQDKNGPAALALSPIAPESLSAFTCTFWYYLDELGPDLHVPLDTAGVVFLLHRTTGFEVRVANQSTQPYAYSFVPGVRGPLVNWQESNRWIFVAFSWEKESNRMAVYQGTPDAALAFMRTMQREAPGRATMPRTNLARDPETIGNTHRNLDRPLAGRMDNMRFFDRVLDRDELEAIHRADTSNTPVTFK